VQALGNPDLFHVARRHWYGHADHLAAGLFQLQRNAVIGAHHAEVLQHSARRHQVDGLHAEPRIVLKRNF